MVVVGGERVLDGVVKNKQRGEKRESFLYLCGTINWKTGKWTGVDQSAIEFSPSLLCLFLSRSFLSTKVHNTSIGGFHCLSNLTLVA